MCMSKGCGYTVSTGLLVDYHILVLKLKTNSAPVYREFQHVNNLEQSLMSSYCL